jgi:hypothetical protein
LTVPDLSRRPSWTDRVTWWPKGHKITPALEIHLRLVFADAGHTQPHAIYLTPTRSAGKQGSGLHARCEEIGMLISWALQGGMSLDDMATRLKPSVLEGSPDAEGLALFAVRSAIDLRDSIAAQITGAGAT